MLRPGNFMLRSCQYLHHDWNRSRLSFNVSPPQGKPRIPKPDHIAVRLASNSASSSAAARFKLPDSNSPFRVSHIFAALLTIGIGATIFGLYDFYQTLTKWPPEVRGDLRSGLRAKARKDLKLSQRYLRRAWETVKTLPGDVLSPEPFLKLSGIAIALAEVLEADNKSSEAYEIYAEALQIVRPSVKDDIRPYDPKTLGAKNSQRSSLSTRERKCTVGLALKLSELAEEHNLPATDEERWLNHAVSEVMRILQDDHSNAGAASEPVKNGEEDELQQSLPAWVSLSKSDMAIPMERLASFYRRQGVLANYSHIMTLYQLALQVLLMSENSQSPSVEDQCRAAMVTNNMSETVVQLYYEGSEMKNKSTSLETAARMAQHAVVKSKKAIDGVDESHVPQEASLCAKTLLFSAYNVAIINSLLGKDQLQGEDESRFLDALEALGRDYKEDMSDPDVQEIRRAWREFRRDFGRNKTK